MSRNQTIKSYQQEENDVTAFAQGPGYQCDTRNRIVEIFVSDPDSFSVPHDQALLLHRDRFTTDKTDNEIMLELQLPALVADWNPKRIKLRDKRFRETEVMLEPMKVRDLRVAIATVVTL